MTSTAIDQDAEAEKLRHVRALIEELLREADVCAHVVLAGRAGRFELFQVIDPSWSNLRMEKASDGRDGIRLRSKAADYVGRPELRQTHLAWSVGVVSGLSRLMGEQAMAWLYAADMFDRQTDATHTDWTRDDPRDGRQAS